MIIDLNLYREQQKETEIPETEPVREELEEQIFQEQGLTDREELIAAAFGLMELGDYHSAITCFETLLRGTEPFNDGVITPMEQADCSVHIARCYKELYHQYQEEPFLEDALLWATEAIKHGDQPAPLYNNRGNIYTLLNRYELALDDYNRAVDLNQEIPLYHFNRGNILDDLGDHQGAIESYDRAIDLDPEYESAIYNRGNSYNQLKDYGAAVADYNRVLTINPQHALSYNNRGSLYEIEENYSAAIEDFTRAIELEPLHPLAYFNRGMVYDRLGDATSAQRDYEVAIELNPEDPDIYFHLIELLMVTDQFQMVPQYLLSVEELITGGAVSEHHRAIFTMFLLIDGMIREHDVELMEKALFHQLRRLDRWRWNFDDLTLWLQKTEALNGEQHNTISNLIQQIKDIF